MGADPALTTLPRGGVDHCAAIRAAATVVPTVGREGRSEAVSAAAGSAGKKSEKSSQQLTQSDIFDRDFF